MSLQILTPQRKSPKIIIARGVTHQLTDSKKRAREQLDRLAEKERVGWNQVKLLAQERFGKVSGFSLNECKMLMEAVIEIAREKRGWR
jgi:hypothetical protein